MKFRPMKMADAMQMLKWKNYPETRKFAIVSHDKIKYDDHVSWLKNNIQYFQVITDQMDTMYGAVRVQDGEISIWVDRKFWGQGIATWAIKRASFKKELSAKIVNGNVESMRAFLTAGYKLDSYDEKGFYILKRCK